MSARDNRTVRTHDGKLEVTVIGTAPKDAPYLWIGEKVDGGLSRMLDTIDGRQLRQLRDAITRALGETST